MYTVYCILSRYYLTKRQKKNVAVQTYRYSDHLLIITVMFAPNEIKLIKKKKIRT